ncbi:hypothetical protein AB835_08520 [Candidatus Endobugula sertula]|uniref:ABC transporter substrate-binding protein n=1 Tax=Candidatus Endobugula sertula TaxID=62101 RepID=A0A1D2QPN1_9GAMM|nr:hypothetical protein AB835_08520 [Candidatus Endobugula sertula]
MLSLFRTSILKSIFFVVSTLLPSYTFSDVIIVSPPQEKALTIARKIKENINTPTKIVSTLNQTNTSDIIITLGKEALDQVTKKPHAFLISSFINPLDRSVHYNKYGIISHSIYSEPSPDKISYFLISHFKNQKIGLIYTSEEKVIIDEIKIQLSQSSTDLISIKYSGDIFKDIRNLKNHNIDLLLLTKNRNIYQPRNVAVILRSLFTKQIPVIATSKSLLKTGATVAVIPSEDSIIKKTYNLANQILSGENANKSGHHYVSDMDIYTNKTMADVYNVDIRENLK